MKLKKFFKPLVTVSALSMLLMGCAEDSSNSGGSTTPPTAESVFSNFLAGFQATPAKNAAPLEFTTNKATAKTLKVAQGKEVQYLVSLDDVMATYYAVFGITGSSTLLTEAGSGLTLPDNTKIKNYAKVDTSAEASIDLTLTNSTNSLYTGMFALMTEENVKALDTALGELDKEIETSKPTGETNTPDLTKIQAATVQKVVDLINGNMYKVAYNSPAQSVQTALANAQTLTLSEGMAFNVDDSGAYKIGVGKLSYKGANPAIADGKVVVFLDEFKNKLNGVAAGETGKDTVKGEDALNTNTALGITTDTASGNTNAKAITYTPTTKDQAGAKVTYIAILENKDTIDGSSGVFSTLNNKIDEATKADVDAALKELGTIYKIDYTVNTFANLIETFKASEAVKAAVASAKAQQNLTFTANEEYNNSTYLYCLYEDKSIKLNTVAGNDVSADVIAGYVNGGAGSSTASNQIVFTENSIDANGTYYAYCTAQQSEAYTASGTTNYEKLADFLGKLTAEENGLGLQVFAYEKTEL